MAWPDTPVKSTAAQPMPQPINATLLAVVISAAAVMSSIQLSASLRVDDRISNALTVSAAAGSTICASPSRVTRCQIFRKFSACIKIVH